MKPPEPKPLSPLLLHAVKLCPKCRKTIDGRADDMAMMLYGKCFACLHGGWGKTRRQPLP